MNRRSPRQLNTVLLCRKLTNKWKIDGKVLNTCIFNVQAFQTSDLPRSTSSFHSFFLFLSSCCFQIWPFAQYGYVQLRNVDPHMDRAHSAHAAHTQRTLHTTKGRYKNEHLISTILPCLVSPDSSSFTHRIFVRMRLRTNRSHAHTNPRK